MSIDKQYQDLLQTILDYGVDKKDRTGTGTRSIFGYTIRHNMKDGFPLLTTKKMAWKTLVTELLWFLRGDTNIKYLVDNNCHIWDGDAFKNYLNTYKGNFEMDKEEFINAIKTNPEFAATYGELGPIYGKQWRNWEADDKHFEQLKKPIDQITNLISELKTNPDSRRLMVSAWNVGKLDEMKKFALAGDSSFHESTWDLGPIYGKQWRRWKGKLVDKSEELNAHTAWVPEQIDQIANLISELKTNPDSRRLMVSAWNVGELDQMVLPPCHYGFQVYTRELSEDEQIKWYCSVYKESFEDAIMYFKAVDLSKPFKTLEEDVINFPTRAISLMWNQRSVDTFLGLPFNIASYGLLLELIAKAVNMVPDELIGNLGDVHLYSNHIEQAKEQISRTPYELPKLNINTEFWPTKNGSCGEGPLDAVAVFNSFKDDNFCKCLLEEDIQLGNYQSHPTIKAPLSN